MSDYTKNDAYQDSCEHPRDLLILLVTEMCSRCGRVFKNEIINPLEENIALHQDLWERLAKSLSCGYCGEATTVESPFTCKTCGRMLCEDCGRTKGVCRDHTENNN